MRRALAVFASVAVADLAWTHYVAAVAGGHALTAVVWSALIVALGAVTTRAVVASGWYVLPALLGGAVGTFLGMRP